MNRYQLEKYRKFLLNRVTTTNHITEYIEHCISSDDEAASHSFHKIIIQSWEGTEVELYETLADYFSPNFIPVNYTAQGNIKSFYTSSLGLVLKIVKLDFLFPYQRNMFTLDILFNDKSSADCFEHRVTVENIVTSVVSNRFNEKLELDLSNFGNDPEFLQKKINFYKINLLASFKILMLRMGRDTKILNLSNNNIQQVPVEILNFFIKGDLVAINLSHNNLSQMNDLIRVTSRVEKLWLEGNPLCETVNAVQYVKQLFMKFPRLIEIDGVPLNENGFGLPFARNFLETPDRKTKMIVEKFMSLYFAHYDSGDRSKLSLFYDHRARLTIANNFTDVTAMEPHVYLARNILDANKKKLVLDNKMFGGRDMVVGALQKLPPTLHDPTTFTVDVMKHDKTRMILVIDGLYKELTKPEHILQFRRTFVFDIATKNNISEYLISNEMFQTDNASKELSDKCFKLPLTTTNPMALKNPEIDDKISLANVFSHLTNLKTSEAELRLKLHYWDITKALKEFVSDMKSNTIPYSQFIEQSHSDSDFSSLSDEEID